MPFIEALSDCPNIMLLLSIPPGSDRSRIGYPHESEHLDGILEVGLVSGSEADPAASVGRLVRLEVVEGLLDVLPVCDKGCWRGGVLVVHFSLQPLTTTRLLKMMDDEVESLFTCNLGHIVM